MKESRQTKRRIAAAHCKEKARQHLRENSIEDDPVITDREIGKHANNPCACSCYMCGNPRKYAKGKESKTVQERRIEQAGKLGD